MRREANGLSFFSCLIVLQRLTLQRQSEADQLRLATIELAQLAKDGLFQGPLLPAVPWLPIES